MNGVGRGMETGEGAGAGAGAGEGRGGQERNSVEERSPGPGEGGKPKRSHKKRASGGGRGDFGLDLPASRVRRNAQLAAHPRGVSAEAGLALSVAAELFLTRIAGLAWGHLEQRSGAGRANLEYDDLAAAVAAAPMLLDFLHDVVPPRCPVSDLLPPPSEDEDEEEDEADSESEEEGEGDEEGEEGEGEDGEGDGEGGGEEEGGGGAAPAAAVGGGGGAPGA